MIVSNIEKLMTSQGVSILKLSMETGLATRTLMRARGPLISKCRLETLEKISRCLGVSTKDLYDEHFEPRAPDPTYRRHLSA